MKHLSNHSHWGGKFLIGMATFLIAIVQADDYLVNAPSFLTPCKAHDSNNGQCVTDMMIAVFAKWKGDIPGRKAFPSLDPLKLKRIHVTQNEPPLAIKLDITNVIATGLANAIISNGRVQNGENFNFTVKLPKFRINGKYTMKGRILVLDVDGQGPVFIDISDLVLSVSFKMKTVERDGEHFLVPLTLKTNVTSAGDIHVRFENLFGDNQDELNDIANDLLNENREPLVDVMSRVVEETMDVFLFDRKKKIFSRIPARYVFTDLR